MRIGSLLVAIGLGVASFPAISDPLEPPTVKTTFQIERERGGSCSQLHVGRPGARPELKMMDVCHGWDAMMCADKIFVRGEGVVEDQAQVLFTELDRATDLAWLVKKAIRARWPGHEYLHLQFGSATCDGTTLVAPFSGSHIKANSMGPAAAMVGTLRIIAPNDSRVSVGPGG